MLAADFFLPSAVFGPVLAPPCILQRIVPFLVNIPGALQGRLPCFVKVWQGSRNLLHFMLVLF
jgi:hypothetical protein